MELKDSMPKDFKPKGGTTSYSPYKSRGQPRWGPTFKFDFPRKTEKCWNEANWRASKIPESVLIKKTDAEYWYHLRPEDIDRALTPLKEERFRIPNKNFTETRKLYREVDIEKIAWRKYGGPFHFERFLLVARENHFSNTIFERFPPRYSYVLQKH